jgi:long-chain acyl-CoA synthetase
MPLVQKLETLVGMFEHAVANHAQRPACGTHRNGQWDWLTYEELGVRVARCRSGLAALGVGRGDRVAIIADNRAEWIVAAHATYQRRAIFVPVAEAQSESDWRYVLADTGARVCFAANAAIAGRVSALREDLLDLQYIVNLDAPEQDPASFAHLLKLGAEREVKSRAPQPSDCATIIYTSGTTGEPKGVRLTHGNLSANASARAEALDYGPEPRSVAFLPWAHVFGGHVELNVMLLIGGAIAICSGTDELLAAMPVVKPTVLYGVPRVFRQLYHDIQRDLAAEPEMSRHMFDDGLRLMQRQRRGESLKLTERIFLNMADKLVISKLKARFGGKLRLSISGAAPLSVEIIEFFDNLGLTIYQGYGLTESSGSTTINPKEAPRFGSVGKPVPGTHIEIDRTAAPELGELGEGEVIIHGAGVMQGYHNRPDETRQALTENGGLRTGDLGYLDGDGYLYITGRIKELYKLDNGRYVAPAPLEEKLKLSPFVLHCMLYGAGQPYNVALIMADIPALRAHLAREDASAKDLISDPRARRLYEEEILKHSRDFRAFELVRNFWLVSEPFTRENGMLSPALKLLRRRVLEKYEARLKSLY